MPGHRRHLGHDGPRRGEHIELLQGRQPQPQCVRTQAVVARVRMLLHHAHLLKTDQVVVHVGHGQLTGVGNFLQR
ncbi:hypothetical protein D3C78_1719990 [compost metagenome]